MPRLEPQRHVTPEEVAEALRLPDDFASSNQRLGVTWGLGPVLTTRDSGWKAKAFEEAILAHLNSDPSLANDWDIQRASHWGGGWCEQIIFKVLDGKEPSRIFKVLLEFTDSVQEYGGVDDEFECKHRREEIEEYISNNLVRDMRDDLPDDWIQQMADELERLNAVQDEPSGDIFISREDARKAVINLDFQEVEDEEEADSPQGN